MPKASYQCMKCFYEWDAFPGPVTCPMCQDVYVNWTNFQELKDAQQINEGYLWT